MLILKYEREYRKGVLVLNGGGGMQEECQESKIRGVLVLKKEKGHGRKSAINQWRDRICGRSFITLGGEGHEGTWSASI